MPDIIHKPCPFVACGSSDAFSYHTEKRVGKCHSCGGSYPSREETYDWAEDSYPKRERDSMISAVCNHKYQMQALNLHVRNGNASGLQRCTT